MGNWLGNCSDPKVLFEEAVAKSDQIIGFVRYQTFHDSEKKEGRDNYLNLSPYFQVFLKKECLHIQMSNSIPDCRRVIALK